MKNKRKFFRRTVSVILTLCLIASSSVCAFASSLISEETTAKSKEIANMIESEGIVLLKNEDDALPLKERKVNVFGAASCSIAFAGAAGSGAVRSSDAVGFYDALTNAGIEYNKDLYKTYASHTGTLFDLGFIGYIITVLKQFFGGGQSEMPVNKISDKLMSSAVEYSDNAIIVIGRVGTEMKDLSVEQLNLTADEKEMIDKVCSLFDNVIVVFNISNIMDMSWIEDYDSIKAAMIMWLPGEVGTDSVGKVLTGEVNPSGKLVDTVSYDIEDHPASENFGNYMYKGILGIPKYFVNYSEGIYVGYRYFETLAPEKVQYPFGFGLSYTDFEWNVTSYSANDEKITVKVNVKNTGDVAGKDVVQVYFAAPYYEGGIEKSATELAAYAKTELLEPGDSDTLEISFSVEDMASYDSVKEQAWVLDEGEYEIRVARDVRTFVKTFTYTVDEKVVYKTDDNSGNEINNLFEDAEGDLTYFSRADVKGTYPTPPTDYKAPDIVKNSDRRPDRWNRKERN